MKAYYNEFDKNAAAWLRELISDGLIAPGDVDERSIIDVDYKDLEGYTQHHFFAGIGGWSYALRLAQWPDNKPVWTASLPCQPFSAAGKGLGKADERHLLPHFLELVAKCKPDTIFGEQVERAIGHGWLDDLQATMEAENYAIGHCVLGAHSVSAAHIRQRLYWVADSYKQGLEGRERTECTDKLTLGENSLVDGIGTSNSTGSQHRIEAAETARHRGSVESAGDSNRMADTNGKQDNATNAGRFYFESRGNSDIEWLYCRDGKYRPIESSSIWMVNGLSCRMVQCGDKGIAHLEINEKEMKRAEKTPTYSRDILPALQREDGEEKISQFTRRYDSFQKEEILQPSLHGDGLRRGNENGNIAQQPPSVEETSQRMLSGVWKKTHAPCPSCGQESYEQRSIEFDDVVFKMPPASTLSEFLGADGSRYMQALRKTGDEDRALLDSQHSAKEVWESLNDQEKDRARLHFNSRIWVYTEALKPLVDGVPRGMVHSSDPRNTQEARVSRLRGYGNAIVPQLAAEFISAFMDTDPLLIRGR